MSSLITLTTDFGHSSTYVAAMKGSLWSIAPDVRIVDLTHDILPQDLRATALFLRDVLPIYPAKSIHVVVVDPGVGTNREALLIEWRDQVILAPDNGCWWPTVAADADAVQVWRLDQPRYWRQPVSSTFHGRDIFAPVAGYLSHGIQPSQLGSSADNWAKLELRQPTVHDGITRGEIVTVDHFGNLISNISGAGLNLGDVRVIVGGTVVGRIRRVYGDEPAGTLIALVSSSGHIEIAEVNGSAARRLGLGIGAVIEIESPLLP